ncbi:MAG: hypothetical protein AAB529_00330 [Patescibacteria group bacterium]
MAVFIKNKSGFFLGTRFGQMALFFCSNFLFGFVPGFSPGAVMDHRSDYGGSHWIKKKIGSPRCFAGNHRHPPPFFY